MASAFIWPAWAAPPILVADRLSRARCSPQAKAAALHAWDRYVIDGLVNGLASLMRLSSEKFRLAQTGQAQIYGAAIFIGVVATIAGVLIANP